MSMYKNTTIYYIYCKDVSVSDTYIGHTTNFINRCRRHEYDSYVLDLKLYRFIREHGGWSNWDIKIICEVSCNSRGEAALEEMYWYIKMGATLNSLIPGINYFKRSILSDKLYKSRQNVLDRIISLTGWPRLI